MAIRRIEIEDFLVFKDNIAIDFCHGVNILIGGNGTGKTTLMKTAYRWVVSARPVNAERDVFFAPEQVRIFLDTNKTHNVINAVYFPEKDILEHARGLLPFIEQKPSGFDQIYRDVLVRAQDIPTKSQTETQKTIGEMISKIIGGAVYWEPSEGVYYTIQTDGMRIPFSHEASGYKKLGFLGLLVASGQLEKDSVLFWDEPDNSLNPELVPVLVSILLELSKSGVQIFLATHDYNLARSFDVRENKGLPVLYHNFHKAAGNGQIVCQSSSEYTKLTDNLLEIANENLFE